jgi:TonB family protein
MAESDDQLQGDDHVPWRPVGVDGRRFGRALALSLAFHVLFLSLTFGDEDFGLPGLNFFWKERRIEASTLRVELAPPPPPPPAEVPPEMPVREVVRQARTGPSTVVRPTVTSVVRSRPAREKKPRPPMVARKKPEPETKPQSEVVTVPVAPVVEPVQRLVEPELPVREVEMPKLEQPRREIEPEELKTAKLEAARVEAERRENERRENERLETERREVARLESERKEAERRELERVVAERKEAERREAERREAERREAERREAERREAERIAAEQRAAELEAQRQEAARLAAERRDAARIEAERQEAARRETARLEAARLEAERREAARLEAERQEALRLEAARLAAAREEEERREARLRAIGRQLDEEARQREAGSNLPYSLSTARRLRLWGRSDANEELVKYAEAWARKIQLNTPVDTVRGLARRPHTPPMVTVAVRSDGSVESVTIVVSSGVAEVDAAIGRIVQSLAPYQAFPPGLARQADVIEVRRTWHFDVAIHLN